MADKYVPRLDNYFLDIISTRDEFESALAVHEYPFSNRNKIEHIGQRPRRIYVECSFQENPALTPGWEAAGSVALPTYAEHFFFLDYIKSERKSFTFTHPKYGEINGKIQNITSFHDDTQEYVQIRFEFIEEILTDEISFVQYVIPEMAVGFTDTNTKVTEAVELEEKEATNSVQWIAAAQLFISDLNLYLNTLTSPARSIINTINYGTSYPGQILQAINGAVDRVVELYQTGRDAPASFINNIIAGVRGLKAEFTGVNADRVHIMGSSRVAYEAAVLFDEDDQKFRTIKDREATPSFDNAGNWLGVSTLPEVLTITELEFSLYQVRELINEAILIDRDNRPLQLQARQLQDYVDKIKLDRDRIETKSYQLQTLHEIARDNGLTYHAAERILKLNTNIKNPNFTYGDVKVLIPAD